MYYMDLTIFKSNDPSGRVYKESYLSKNHKEEYEYIINYCEKINLSDIPFKEKVYITLKSLNTLPLCKNVNCEN